MTGLFKAYFSSNKDLYLSIKNIFGFFPGNIFLYKLALRHKSASEEKINGLKINNERLEYLGDAILSAIVADYLFKHFPYQNEGFLTEMRAKIVSRSSLNKLSKKLALDKLILAASETRGKRKSAGGDAFEALVGALYLDKGYIFTRKIIVSRIIDFHFDIDQLVGEEVSYKSRVIEWSQKEKREVAFNVVDEIGEKQNKQYVVELTVDNIPLVQSQDYSIKGAEKLAAEKAWNIIDEDEYF